MISIQGLSKAFGSHQAVRDLDLHVPVGQIYGLVGPDGAGKTTALVHQPQVLLLDEPTTGVDPVTRQDF